MRGLRFVRVLLGLILALPLQADEVPYRLADIARDPGGLVPWSGSSGFLRLGDRLLFSTTLFGDNGILWSTDGTPGGTIPVSSSLCPSDCQVIRPLESWNGLTFLSVYAGEGSTAQERLFRTDGTPQGTFQILPGDLYLESWSLQAAPDSPFVYFVACGFEEGCRLWRSDGSVAGTGVLRGADGLSFHDPGPMAVWRGRLWFAAPYGDGSSIQLWSTDGTPEGTRRLTDFGVPEFGSPEVETLVALGDRLVFVVHSDGTRVVWSSDGTASGTGPRFRLPGRARSGFFRAGSSWLFFVGFREPGVPWILNDGLSQASPLSCGGGKCPSFEAPLGEAPSGGLLFSASDPQHGRELWITDGTGPGTLRLTDACPGDCQGVQAYYGGVRGPDGEVYFMATPRGSDDFEGELWVTDGTPGGTCRVRAPYSRVGFLDGRLYFQASRDRAGALELQSMDGPGSAPRRVKTLRRFAAGSRPLFLPSREGMVLAAEEEEGRLALWKSDGTPEGTRPFFRFPEGGPRRFEAAPGTAGGGQLLATVQQLDADDQSAEIWRTDGRREGTWRLLRLDKRKYLGSSWTSWTGKVLFLVQSGYSCSVWSSDGTAPGTREILPLAPGVQCPDELMGFGPRFLFVARAGRDGGAQLFVSDGTPAGTRQISDIHPVREGDEFQQHFQVGRTMFFRLFQGASAELWRTDGTARGTRPAFPGIDSPDGFVLFRGSLYFTAQMPGSEVERGLFRASPDGGDPLLLAQVGTGYQAGAQYFHIQVHPFPVGDRLVFAGMDPEHGVEPWVTDGTPGGTRLLADLIPGPDSSSPHRLAGAGGKLFFAARGPADGEELWETDGTATGTREVLDLAPGGASSSPYDVAIWNGFLFFAADDGRTGVEPWVLRLK